MTAKQAELAARYGIISPYPEDLAVPPGELFPDKPAYVVREQDGARVIDTMAWDFPAQGAGQADRQGDRKAGAADNAKPLSAVEAVILPVGQTL